jgi:pyruvate/2-oxoglutarate dehydrogenase complex dihydrolipoamide dehydrogenase (E3) component
MTIAKAITEAHSGVQVEGFFRIFVREGTDRMRGDTNLGRCTSDVIDNTALAMVAGQGLGQVLGLRRLTSPVLTTPRRRNWAPI